MKENTEVKKYWFNDVVSLNLEGEVWLPIEDFMFYEVSNYGRIRGTMRNETKIVKQRKTPSYKTTYLSVSILNNKLLWKTLYVHVLVCRAFNGIPSDNSYVYDVNHMDGDKHNNVPSNLEWMTRGQNLLHAYQIGLRKDSTPVIVKDMITGKIDRYYSMLEFGRQFNIPEERLATFFSKHRSKLYMDRYEIKKDFSNRNVSKYEWVKDIKAFDYTKKEMIIASDSATMENSTNVNRATITGALRRKYNGLINGFVFKYLHDKEEFPEYSEEEINLSKEEYGNKKERKEKEMGMVVKDYVTNTIKEYDSSIEASKETGISRTTIMYFLQQNKMDIFRGKIFRYKSNKSEWPVYTKDIIDLSLRLKNNVSASPVRITDSQTNTTKLYTSVAEFAREIGENSKCVNSGFLHNGKYKNRWYAERVKV